jgi:2-polyprenyl-6-methoxyphenol hydroxylase-like FAD-dependent oxidoreductase
VSQRHALVSGCGIAGLTCARLLAAHGWRVDCALGPPSTPGPVVVISRPTADLLLQLWHADEGLFLGAHRLRGRTIHWEDAAAPAHSVAPALAMPVDILRARLFERVQTTGLGLVAPQDIDFARYDWTVQAGGREADPREAIAFGRRRGIMASVKLAPRARTDRTVMESVPGGWLFLIPQGLGRGALQAILAGGPGEPRKDLRRLLAQSQSMSSLVEDVVSDPATFAAMPRLAAAPCTSRSIAVGDAALTLDPMSGSGIGSGLRSAILAAAVLDAAGRDARPQACFDHYTRRLRDTMRSHVRTCVDFYERAEHAADWRGEIDAMVDALGRLPDGPVVPPFMLNHGHLERVPQGEWV